MSQNQNLIVLQKKASTIRALLEKDSMKRQIAMAIPKHMNVDRLLRVAMTSIRTNPKLLECTQESLLACIMGCAALGLEPEPFLGQAYLVPYNRKIKLDGKEVWRKEAQLIPGYRGYIALARRSGEVKSVTAQVVYENDHFEMEYGLDEILKHVPAENDRGTPKGAYVIFRYKDGSHSFDYMSVVDIEKIRARSKSPENGPWVTDWDEMAKKTVIRRHIKLVPLSVEMATAAAAEEKAFLGESQVGLFSEVEDVEYTEVSNGEPEEAVDPEVLKQFDELVKAQKCRINDKNLMAFLSDTAAANNCAVDTLKAKAVANFEAFWAAFQKWQNKQEAPQDKMQSYRAITDDTMEAIRIALKEKEIDLAMAYQENGIDSEVPLNELDEATGETIKAWLEKK